MAGVAQITPKSLASVSTTEMIEFVSVLARATLSSPLAAASAAAGLAEKGSQAATMDAVHLKALQVGSWMLSCMSYVIALLHLDAAHMIRRVN